MKKILVAEDNKLILETINHKLQKDGYDVVKVLNGKDCLEHLQDNDVDLLITDLYMPFVNGHEVINTVRNEWNRKTHSGMSNDGTKTSFGSIPGIYGSSDNHQILVYKVQWKT